MSKRRDWDKVGELVSKIKELGLSYKEGAERFGISVGVLYEYSRRQKKQSIEGVSSGSGEPAQHASRRSRSLPAELKDMIAEYFADQTLNTVLKGFKTT